MADLDPNMQYIFKALDISEVSLADFADLTNISRVTLHRWRGGLRPTDKLRLKLAYTWAQRLETACRDGRLPLPEKLKRTERVAAVRKIVAELSQK